MRNRIVRATKPISAYLSLASSWAFFNCHDGVIVGTSEDAIQDRSFGGGGSIGGAELPLVGSIGTGWSANPAWFTSDGTIHFADQMADVPAYDALVPAVGGAMLVWAQINADYAGATNANPTVFSLGDQGTSTATAGVMCSIDRAQRRLRCKSKGDGTGSRSNQAASNTNAITSDQDHVVGWYLDFNALTVDGYVDGVQQLQGTLSGPITTAGSGNALNYIAVGSSYLAGSVETGTPWLDQIRRVGVITFAPDSHPSNVPTLMQRLSDFDGLLEHPIFHRI